MIHALSPVSKRRIPFMLFSFILWAGSLYFFQVLLPAEMPVALATTRGPVELNYPYEITTSEVEVDWKGGGDFDPRGKCPTDFFAEGFVLLCKKVGDGAFFKFLYHRGKNLLYRVDKDVIRGHSRIGLHWVESTKFNARYRIADTKFKGGKMIKVPNARGGKDVVLFEYGQPVSKKKVQPGRELFYPTHIEPDQCPEWWDIFNFIP